jgi:hypothetical protein
MIVPSCSAINTDFLQSGEVQKWESLIPYMRFNFLIYSRKWNIIIRNKGVPIFQQILFQSGITDGVPCGKLPLPP